MDDWKSARFTKTLPALAVTPDLHERVKSYASGHKMKLSEVMRKALVFYLSSELPDGKSEMTKSQHKSKLGADK